MDPTPTTSRPALPRRAPGKPLATVLVATVAATAAATTALPVLAYIGQQHNETLVRSGRG